MLRSFARTGGLGDNIVEVYRNALGSLCEEQSRARLDNRAPTATTGAERLAVASRIAACSVLGARPLVWTGPPPESDGTDLTTADICGAPGDDGPPALSVTPGLVIAALRTALFCGRGPDRLGWVHRTYAEFLAALHLVEGRAGRAQIETLLVAEDDTVYPQLRPLAAWLAANDPDTMGWLAVQDPLLFLTVPIGPPSQRLRAQIVDGLFARAASSGIDQRFGQHGSHLAHDGLAPR
ncbi:MAG: hypothetical protein M3083_10495 [Actinomycetota bacterium]|nr:hypothetical protein [Actinomycetota bacterium]